MRCGVALGALSPEYFEELGIWQKRYGRDNLKLSRPFGALSRPFEDF